MLAVVPTRERKERRLAVRSRRGRPRAANLALALNTLSTQLADVGRREQALAAVKEAVDIRRALAEPPRLGVDERQRVLVARSDDLRTLLHEGNITPDKNPNHE